MTETRKIVILTDKEVKSLIDYFETFGWILAARYGVVTIDKIWEALQTAEEVEIQE